MKAQYGILRFKKYKGPAISPIEAHNERTKEQYASNPDIDTSRSRYNLHLVQPQGRYVVSRNLIRISFADGRLLLHIYNRATFSLFIIWIFTQLYNSPPP